MTKSLPRWLLGLDVIAAIMILVNIYMALIFAPDAMNLSPGNERMAQHIFYFHMGCNAATGIALLLTFLSSILYLVTRSRIWDIVAVSAVELGIAFGFGILASGSIWAKSTWNAWWTWDPRLTSAAITLLIYVAYLMLRGAVDDPGRRARFAAVYGVFAFISVPITFASIRLWRTIHPVLGSSGGSAQGAFDSSPNISMAFRYSMLAFSILAITLLIHRIRLEWLKEEVEQLKERFVG